MGTETNWPLHRWWLWLAACSLYCCSQLSLVALARRIQFLYACFRSARLTLLVEQQSKALSHRCFPSAGLGSITMGSMTTACSALMVAETQA